MTHFFLRKFITTLLIIFISIFLPLFASAADIRLAWDPNSETDLAGYKVYYGTASRTYGNPINVGNVTTYTLTGLISGQTYFIAVTAYDTSANESGYSNEVSGTGYDSETVSTPGVLSGPTTGTTGTSYTYTTGGSSSNLGHTVEYQFDWKGDGTDLSAWGSATQSKTWTVAGTYNVRSRARCATHTTVVSSWSSSLTVTISAAPQSFTVTTNPSGRQITVDSLNFTAPQTFSWTPGSSHTLSVASPQSGSTGTRYIYSSWSDGGAQTHAITAPSSAATYTAQFTTQYSLTTSGSPSAGGAVSPSGTNWYNSGQSVSISATANAGYAFSSWSGDLSGSTNPTSINMDGPKNVVANFATVTETISTPTVPSGPTTGNTSTSYDYSTGGSSSNLGHTVEYQFDWKGDGSDLSAWGSATQSKTWTVAGTYNVRSRARCTTHTSVVSSWSGSITVSISSPPISQTVATNPSELQITVDGLNYTAPQTFSWTPGSSHTLSVSSPQPRNKGTRYFYISWSDGGAQTHAINIPSSNASYTASFKKQSKLTTSANLPEAGTLAVNGTGVTSGSSSWFDDNQTVSIQATPNSDYTFTGWSGDVSGTANPISVDMNDPKDVIANFALISGAATLVSPSGTVNTTTPSYVWNAVSNSTWYYLSVDDSTGNKILQWYSAVAALCGSGTGTCSITPSTPLAPGAAQWKIQTYNGTDYGPWSIPMPFIANTIFVDVPSDYWAEEYVNAIYNAGMTTGCAQDDPTTPENERRYCPDDFVTREQMAALLVRAVEGEPSVNYCDSGAPFPDVTPDMWSCRYIKRLYELGITTGYTDGRYRPYDIVPREQMAAFLVRAVEGEPPENYCASGIPFPDVASDMWSCDYIKKLKDLNITTGYQNGMYGPYDLVTRAQMAAFLARAFLGMQ